MQLRRFDTADAFMAVAGDFLAAREAEHNLILGLVSNLARDADAYDGPPLLVTVSQAGDDEPVAVAIRTPPYNLIISEVDHPESVVPALVSGLSGEELPGVVGPPEAARAFAEGWVAAHGGEWRIERDERIYQLTDVVDPKPGQGMARPAGASDRETVSGWLVAFQREALDEEAEAGMIARAIDGWLRGNGRRFWLWEVDGRPVSLVSASGRTPNGIRIGPVYTPPADRGNGYASRLTAWVSRALLAEGRRYCFLYTDLGNSTANHIYQDIGYRPVTDAVMLSLRA